MHESVLKWVSQSFDWWGEHPKTNFRILEFGSLDINGSVRLVLEQHAREYVGIDIQHGKGVDIVADASLFMDIEPFDVVVCCEVFEHTPKWPKIVSNAWRNLRDGGLFIATMAGEGRQPHSAIDERPIRDFEYYSNVTKQQLHTELSIFRQFETDVVNADTRGRAIK
jgi:SAM-dependent methyltransferase